MGVWSSNEWQSPLLRMLFPSLIKGLCGQFPTDSLLDCFGTLLEAQSCAYNAIRKAFPRENGQYHGFEEEEEED